MPNVTAEPVRQSNGDLITSFVDTVGKGTVTWAYTEPQDHIRVCNKGAEAIEVTVNSEASVLEVGDKLEKDAAVSSFSAKTVNADSEWTNQISVVSVIDAPAPEAGSVPWSGVTDKPANFPTNAASITDASTVGRNVLKAADPAAARTAMGAGTSSLTLGTTSATAKAGDYTPPNAGAAVRGIVLQAATQANSAAIDVAGLVADHNALLAKLKAAGIMA
ncbi:head fiber protein [Paenibacillus sp. FSL L8-0436]|uniref:head fiber protein n=2 Tax=Paenibacillus sp. FSL L8-0436 TaxID=2954686 RepID=UPI00315868C8